MSPWAPFLESARRSIALAQEAAVRYGHVCVGSEHIVLGVLEVDESPLLPLFEERGLSIDSYRERVAREPQEGQLGGKELLFSSEAKRLIELSFERAREYNANYVGAEHIVAAIARMPQSAAGKFLRDLGFDLDAVAARMAEQVSIVTPPPVGLGSSRRSYERFELDESHVDRNPIAQLAQWIAQAREMHVVEPNAMAVSTVDGKGRPSSRIVLLRGLDERGLVFYTSYLSRKGSDISRNPHAAALFYWGVLERQVRIEGLVERVSDEESDAYFASRPRGHQLAAWASEQSEPVDSRALLAQRVEDYRSRFEDAEVPRPHSWGGYLIRPERIEFWQGRENRLHDRLEFVKTATAWHLQRLSP